MCKLVFWAYNQKIIGNIVERGVVVIRLKTLKVCFKTKIKVIIVNVIELK